MGACQGRVCGTAAQTLFGWDVAQTRPPISPAQIGTLMLAADSHTDADREAASVNRSDGQA